MVDVLFRTTTLKLTAIAFSGGCSHLKQQDTVIYLSKRCNQNWSRWRLTKKSIAFEQKLVPLLQKHFCFGRWQHSSKVTFEIIKLS